MSIDFTLPADLEAHDPPEARGTPRDGVRMLVHRRTAGRISHHDFGDLPGLLLPGDLIVVNTSGTLPAEVRADDRQAVHFSTPLPDGSWLVELRTIAGPATIPNQAGAAGDTIRLPAGARLTLAGRVTGRLWRARLSTAVVPYLLRHGIPIRYSYVRREWPLAAYQTVFATRPGSAEMPSASRPFTPEVVTRLVARGVTFAPLMLDTGVSSLEGRRGTLPRALRCAARHRAAGQPGQTGRRPGHHGRHHGGPRAGNRGPGTAGHGRHGGGVRGVDRSHRDARLRGTGR